MAIERFGLLSEFSVLRDEDGFVLVQVVVKGRHKPSELFIQDVLFFGNKEFNKQYVALLNGSNESEDSAFFLATAKIKILRDHNLAGTPQSGFERVWVITQASGLLLGSAPEELRIHEVLGIKSEESCRAHLNELNSRTDLPFYLRMAEIRIITRLFKVTDEDLKRDGLEAL